MEETVHLTADLQHAPEQEPPAPTAAMAFDAQAAEALEEGLSEEVVTVLRGEAETHVIRRWTASLKALPEAGAPGEYAVLDVHVPGVALPDDTTKLFVGAGAHWETLSVNPVGLDEATLSAALDLELDAQGQWAGTVELIALSSTVPTMFADTDIIELPGCAGLPPMRHVLYRITTRSGLGYSRLEAQDSEWAEFDGRRTLLFIHGTGLNAQKSLNFMEDASDGLVSALVKRYGGRMLAFNHSTVFCDVPGNIEALLDLMPTHNPATGGPMRLDLDVVAVSRGGLVARYLIEGHGPARGPEISVRNVVFIGTPNDGTYSAVGNNTKCVLGVRCICNQGDPELSGPPMGDPLVQGDLGVGQPGAKNQQPWSALLNAMNRMADGAAPLGHLHPGLRYHAVSSTVWLPEDHSKRDCVDKMFGAAENDLVVPVASTFTPEVRPASRFGGFFPIPPERRLHFRPEDFVTHVDYINQPRVHAQLLEWLPGEDAAVS